VLEIQEQIKNNPSLERRTKSNFQFKNKYVHLCS